MAGNPGNPQEQESHEVWTDPEELISHVQFAIRGAVEINALERGEIRPAIIAIGEDADEMLDQLYKIIASSAQVKLKDPRYDEWSSYLERVNYNLSLLQPGARRLFIHNALLGLRSGSVIPIIDASRGALIARQNKKRYCWIDYNPNIDQWANNPARPLAPTVSQEAAGYHDDEWASGALVFPMAEGPLELLLPAIPPLETEEWVEEVEGDLVEEDYNEQPIEEGGSVAEEVLGDNQLIQGNEFHDMPPSTSRLRTAGFLNEYLRRRES